MGFAQIYSEDSFLSLDLDKDVVTWDWDNEDEE